MASFFMGNVKVIPDLDFTVEDIKVWHKKAFSAKPYSPDADHYNYFDFAGDEDREQASIAIRMLMRVGLWTEEDEKRIVQQAQEGK